jgi:hypothetical protein
MIAPTSHDHSCSYKYIKFPFNTPRKEHTAEDTRLTTQTRDIKNMTSYENSVLKYNTKKLSHASSLFSVIYHWGQ